MRRTRRSPTAGFDFLIHFPGDEVVNVKAPGTRLGGTADSSVERNCIVAVHFTIYPEERTADAPR